MAFLLVRSETSSIFRPLPYMLRNQCRPMFGVLTFFANKIANNRVSSNIHTGFSYLNERGFHLDETELLAVAHVIERTLSST